LPTKTDVKHRNGAVNGRGSRGRFADGNSHGRGRLPAVSQRARLDALLSVVTETAWSEICQRAIIDAADGDRHARDWLSRYLLPRPDVRLSLDTSPIEIVTSTYDYFDAVRAIAHRDGDDDGA